MSNLDKKYPLRLDTRIDFKNLIPHFYISDNETSDFYIKFTNDNQPVSVENVVIAIVVVNPNGQINSSLLDVNIDKGLIYCNLPNELKNVVGVYKAKIMCISEEERLVSNTFEYKVDMDEFAILNEVVEDSDEILLLTQMLSQINVISTEEEKRIENENIRLVNETERITNETNRINNEDERKSNELERITNETKRNNDENERQLKEAERNESELNRESQESIRQNNEVDRIAYDEVLSNNEEERIANESDRITHEESRANSENIRINNENNRERNEQIRQNNEENRKFEFTMQSQSLTDLSMGVNAVKEDILRSESDRKSSEEERKSNELLRISNEDARTSNEETRVRYEESRVEAESTRSANEDTRERSENARKTNENTRVSNENKRITAESTRSSNENIRVNAENRRRNEHTARMAEIDEALANLPNSLPVANQTTLGGIKVGAGLSITADGILSATGGGSGDGFNTISSNLILSLTASEIQNSIDSGTEITLSSLDGIFDENKRYIVEFLGERKLSSIYPTNNNEVIHWNISCNFGDSLVDLYYSTSDNVMKLGIVKKNTDTVVTATDLKVYEEIVTPFDDKYLPIDLTLQNSISIGRIGDIGIYSSAMGFKTEASGNYSFSQGSRTKATGGYSHAEGYDTTASGNASHAEGIGTTASGNASHAEGYGTKASNYYSHSEGCGSTASGIISHAEGFGTKATGGYSHVEGYYTTASSSNQHVQGKYNIEDTENKYAHIVGNGTDDKARSNAHTLDWNGNGWYKGKLSQDGVPTEDKDLTTKRYVDGKVAEIVNSAPETLDTLNELATALGNDPNFATTVATEIGTKVDKVDGKGLSSNDLTDTLKSNYDTAYTHSQSAHFSGSYNDLTDKPTIPSEYNLPIANQTTLGGIKVGAGLSITADGILSATGGGTTDSTNKYDNSNKYDNPYKNKGSVVVKMQTHCHTTNSDGDGTIEQVINVYKSKGFNAICITDHDMITDTNAYNTSDFITILGTEHTVSSLGSLTAYHMNVINTNYVSEKETPFEVYQDYKSNKSFTVKNHPHDMPKSNYEVSYDNGDYLCDAIEIFNGKRQTGYLYAFWRAIETGHKIKHIATDDFHEATASITGKMASNGNPIEIKTITGWIKLYCKEFSKQGIMDALFKGSYISCIEHDMDIEGGDDYIRATTEIPSDFRFVDKNGLVLKEEKNVMTSEYIFNGFEELIMVISQPVDNPTKYAISQCIFNNDVFGKEHKQVVNDKMLCEKIITDKFTPKYHLVNNEDYANYPFLHIKNLELYGKTVADYTNRIFKHSRAIMAFNDELLTLSSELLKQGDYIKDGCLYKNTDEITIDGTWNIIFYKTYTNVNQFRIEIDDKFFKPRGDRIFMCNYAPRISDYGSSNPVVGVYMSTNDAPRYIIIQLDKTEFPNVDTLKAKLNETPLKILYSTFETKVIKLPKEYYIDTLGANEINVMTEASAFSFDMIHNEDVNAPEYGAVSKISMKLIDSEGNYDGTGNGISMNIDGTSYTLSQYNMYPYDYIKDNVIYKCTKSFDCNNMAVVTKLNSTNYFRVQITTGIAPVNFIDYKVVGYNGDIEVWTDNSNIFLYLYYVDTPPYTKTNFPTLANLKALFTEKYPDFKVYLRYKDAIETENITLPEASITKDSIVTMNDKYSSSLFKVN